MSKAKQPFAAGADKPPIRTLSATALALASDSMDTPLGWTNVIIRTRRRRPGRTDDCNWG